MQSLSVTEDLATVARRVIWFEQPREALANPVRFATYAMPYGTHEDMRVLRRYLSDDDLREVLRRAPPGIFDGRSWAYWNLKFGGDPATPFPRREFPDAAS